MDERNGYANAFKPHYFQTAIVALEASAPQVCESDSPFRTSLLVKGSRSDRALKSAIATMYVEGVSTRRVNRIMEHDVRLRALVLWSLNPQIPNLKSGTPLPPFQDLIYGSRCHLL